MSASTMCVRTGSNDWLHAADDAVDIWCAATAAIGMVRFVLQANVVALFACDAGVLRLVVADRLSQVTLDRVHERWGSAREALAAGEPSVGTDPPFVLLPCRDDSGLAGLVHVEGAHAPSRTRLRMLAPLGQVLTLLLRRRGSDDPAGPESGTDLGPAGPEAAALCVLLESHEWNVSHVARRLGVTRMTIYNRLRRAGIERPRVTKGRRTGARVQSGWLR